jgi:hypothetical protein
MTEQEVTHSLDPIEFEAFQKRLSSPEPKKSMSKSRLKGSLTTESKEANKILRKYLNGTEVTKVSF